MDDDELHTVMKYQNQKVMMWKSVRKPVNEGQTVKVMENVVGEYQFDDNSRQLWPPIDDKSLMMNRPHADKIDVDEVRKDDLENVTPHIDLQFPIGVDVQNFDTAIDADREEIKNTEAGDETNQSLEAHVIERKDMQSRNAVLWMSSNVTDGKLIM